MPFKGKVAIITGGAQGIGKAYTLALLDIGMKVCIVDINENTGTEFVTSLSDDYKENAIFHKCDVTSYEQLKSAFDKTVDTFGKIDVVVNNAGVFNEHNWKKTIEVNFIGVVYGIQLGFKYMSKDIGGAGGYIVNTASQSAFEPSPLCPVYSATKCAVVGLTKSYGSNFHFKKSGIKVCAIGPDIVDTSMFKKMEDNILEKEFFLKIKNSFIGLNPEELGKALVQILKDGKNGALMRVQSSGLYYV